MPESHLDATKNAVFDAGAGEWGSYDQCCFEVRGQGQFRPGADSQPFIGKPGQLEYVDEVRVEMICPERVLSDALAALRAAHPYETPAIYVWRLEDIAFPKGYTTQIGNGDIEL